MTADAGEEGKTGKINFYPGHQDSKYTPILAPPLMERCSCYFWLEERIVGRGRLITTLDEWGCI